MGHVVITGGRGFIAQAVARELHGRGHDVLGVDLGEPSDHDWGRVVTGDAREVATWRDHLTGADTVIHAAALVTNALSAQEAWQVNVRATRSVAEAAADAGVPHVVLLSSIAVLSFLNEHPQRWLPAERLHDIDEDLPLMPSGHPYGDSKIAAERALLDLAARGRIETTIIRPADVYGPGSRPWVLEPLAAIAARQLVLPARGRGIFTPVHVDDLARGIAAAVETGAARGQTIFLGGEKGVTCAEYFGHLRRIAGKSGQVPALPTVLAQAGATALQRGYGLTGRTTEVNPSTVSMLARQYTLSNSRARDALGWEEQVPLSEGMRGVDAWAREHGLVG